MADKKVYMLRIEPEDYAAVEKWASDELRSVNGQLEWIIKRMLKKAGRQPKKGTKEKQG